jgi:hypothetical protein
MNDPHAGSRSAVRLAYPSLWVRLIDRLRGWIGMIWWRAA